MLDFRIDTFLAVCRSMNFTRAAEELHITQPAVSQHIRYLEKSYGVKLFDYQGKRLSLTTAGEALFSAAVTMKHDDLFLKKQLPMLGRGQKNLVLGATLTVGEFAVPERLAAYLNRYPETDLHLIVANTHKLLHRIDAGEIDFAIVEGFFEKREYDSLLFPEAMWRFVAHKHILRGRRTRWRIFWENGCFCGKRAAGRAKF